VNRERIFWLAARSLVRTRWRIRPAEGERARPVADHVHRPHGHLLGPRVVLGVIGRRGGRGRPGREAHLGFHGEDAGRPVLERAQFHHAALQAPLHLFVETLVHLREQQAIAPVLEEGGAGVPIIQVIDHAAHVDGIGDDEAVEAEFPAQEFDHESPGEGRRGAEAAGVDRRGRQGDPGMI
jgi:hypothetical protein